MHKQVGQGYYISREAAFLASFDRAAAKWKGLLALSEDAQVGERIVAVARAEYCRLIPQLPYIGGDDNYLTRNLVEGAACFALYKTMKAHGRTLEDAGKLIFDMFESTLQAADTSPSARLAAARAFRESRRARAAESQKRQYPDDWVYDFVEGDGVEFDFGAEYSECGLQKLMRRWGAEELLPYLCATDFSASRYMDTGLVRTRTLANGDDRCSFRYKMGRPVTQGWPPDTEWRGGKR